MLRLNNKTSIPKLIFNNAVSIFHSFSPSNTSLGTLSSKRITLYAFRKPLLFAAINHSIQRMRKSRRAFVLTFHKTLTRVIYSFRGRDRGVSSLPTCIFNRNRRGLCFEGRLLNENPLLSPRQRGHTHFGNGSFGKLFAPPPSFSACPPPFLQNVIIVYAFPWTIANIVIVL
ncbi:hypothetical protein CEXT_152931 [Caerostris extrusa]|uniref:Uncharacterized protein n=1 Tax=Caerostris extrusa TaxID=172846 RepID=A0AAV4NP73_CAEEX|nr:hypothetical protein CEXT_152931 [Caerostris extrusa]